LVWQANNFQIGSDIDMLSFRILISSLNVDTLHLILFLLMHLIIMDVCSCVYPELYHWSIQASM
jgi:hypothetical protein